MEISPILLFEDCVLSEADSLSFSGEKKRPLHLSGFEEDPSTIQEFFSSFLNFDGDVERSSPVDGVLANKQSSFLNWGGESETVQEQKSEFRFVGPGDLTGAVNPRPTKRTRIIESDTSAAIASEHGGNGAGQRRVWVKNRSKAWWNEVDSPLFPEAEFKRGFGMSRATFHMICEELESVVSKKNTMLRSAVPVRQRVAVCIWRLATGEALRDVSKRFGLGISTCHKLILEVSKAIRSVLMPKFLKWPDAERMKAIKGKFEDVSGIPNLCGSMYTAHIPVVAPKSNVGTYFNKRHTDRNRKPCYTVTVQGVVDPSGIFTDISVGWPGSLSDDQVLEKSSLCQGAKGGLLKDSWIVGTSGHALRDWLLVPYTNHGLSWIQHAYNERIEDIQMIARDSFSRMGARWRCLQKRTEMKLEDLPLVLGACCILHNICEMRNEDLDPESSFRLVDDEVVADEPVRSVVALRERDRIALKLLHAGASSFL